VKSPRGGSERADISRRRRGEIDAVSAFRTAKRNVPVQVIAAANALRALGQPIVGSEVGECDPAKQDDQRGDDEQVRPGSYPEEAENERGIENDNNRPSLPTLATPVRSNPNQAMFTPFTSNMKPEMPSREATRTSRAKRSIGKRHLASVPRAQIASHARMVCAVQCMSRRSKTEHGGLAEDREAPAPPSWRGRPL
jgi:hypothetical protein